MGLQLLAPVISIGLNLVASLLQPEIRREQPDPNPRLPNVGLSAAIRRIYGKTRVELIKFYPDTEDKMYEVRESTQSQGGKGGPRVTTVTKTVYGTFAGIACQGETTLESIILNGKEILPTDDFYTSYITFFDGTQTTPWSEIVNLSDPPFNEIVYKGISYIGFASMPLTEDYGGQVPAQASAVLIDNDFGENPTLDLVIGDICQRAGLAPGQIDVSELSTIILEGGFILDEAGRGYRKALEDLMQFYLFTAFEDRTGKVVFKKLFRDSYTPLAIPTSQYLPISGQGIEDKLFIKTTNRSQDLPNFITIDFQNVENSYDPDVVSEPFGQFVKRNDISLNIKLATHPDIVRRQAILILKYQYITQRNNYTFRFPLSIFEDYPTLDLLEIITLPNGEEVQVNQFNVNQDYTVDIIAKAYSPNTNFNYTPVISPPKQRPRIYQPANVDFYIVDPLQQVGPFNPNTLYCFASAPCIIQISTNPNFEGANQVEHLSPSIIYDAQSNLPSVPSEQLTQDFVDVTVDHGAPPETPRSNDGDAYRSKFNLAVAAVKPPGSEIYEGEMIQYLEVFDQGGNSYRLGDPGQLKMWRGRFGSAGFSGRSLIPDGKILVLFNEDNTAYFSQLRGGVSEHKGQTIYARAITSEWQDLSSTPVVSGMVQGNSYKPPAPINIQSTRDREDNISITWEYDPGDFNEYDDGRNTVTYELDIIQTRPTVVDTKTSTSTSYLYSITEQGSDGISLPFEVDIYAISDIGGRGFAASATINPPAPPDPGNSVTFGSSPTGLNQIRYITDSTPETVLPEDDKSLIIVTTSTPTFSVLDFPDTLPTGFEVYVLNAPASDINARVLIQCTTQLGEPDVYDLLRGSSVLVHHGGFGRYNVTGNNRNYTFVNSLQQIVTKSFNYTSNDGSITITPSVPQGDLLQIDFSSASGGVGASDGTIDGELTDTNTLLYTPGVNLTGIKSLRFHNFSATNQVVQVSSKVGAQSLVFDAFFLAPSEEIEIVFDPPWEYGVGDGIEAFTTDNNAVNFFLGKVDYGSTMYLLTQGTVTNAVAPIYTTPAGRTSRLKVVKYYNGSVSMQDVTTQSQKVSNRDLSFVTLDVGDSFELNLGSYYEFLQNESVAASADSNSAVNYFITGLLQ